jgi:branched-chain amino acid transport system ATP-binding protein
MTVILEIDGLSISFGGLKAVDNVTLAARTGEILSVIGPNGAGKTTLFNLISGVYKPQSGSVILEGKDVTGLAPDKLAGMGLTRTFQNLQIFQNMTALEHVMVGTCMKNATFWHIFWHCLRYDANVRKAMPERWGA